MEKIILENGSEINIIDAKDSKRGFIRGRRLTDKEYNEMMFRESVSAEEQISNIIRELGL